MMKFEGNYLFTGVVSVTLNFHPQGGNVNDVTNEGKIGGRAAPVTRSGSIRL